MLLSQQRITPRIRDLFTFSPQKGVLRWYLPEGYKYWLGSAREGIRQILSQKGIKKVGIPAYTCQVVLDAVKKAGCEAVFYDSSVIVEIEDIKKIISKVDALLLCYNYGFLPEIDKIQELCRKNQVLLIEDCAQALGARYQGQLAGSFGDYAVYSFGLSKNIGFCGGLVISKEPLKLLPIKKFPKTKLLKMIINVLIAPLVFSKTFYSLFFPILSSHLRKKPERLNYSCPKLARKIVIKQMERYGLILGIRSRNAEYACSALKGEKGLEVITPLHGETAWLYLVIKSKKAPELRKRLLSQGIDLGRMLTFKCLDSLSPKALQTEKEVLTFALYRDFKEIRFFVNKLKKVCHEQ